MRQMRRTNSVLEAFLLVFIAGAPALAQHTITTVAGGGPNNVPALSSSIGSPCDVRRDGAGNLYIADCVSSRIFKVNPAGNLTIVAGNGVNGYSGDGGPATSAALAGPSGLFVDSAGNLFIADTFNSRIRKVAVGTGVISTIAGNGTPGYSGDGGPATTAEFNQPSAVFVDNLGNIFIADRSNDRIREIAAATGVIQTVVGNGTLGYSGDGGPATSAEINLAGGIFVDRAGNLFIADLFNDRIREVAAATGVINTIAGGGGSGSLGDGGPPTSATLNQPNDVYVDALGNIFIADTSNDRIREIAAATGVIQTVVGNGTLGYSGDGGPATSAELNVPLDVFVDSSGNLFIADSGNSRIREVTTATGIIQTVAGNGADFSGDGGPATSATLSLSFFTGVSADSAGNVFIADTKNLRIREVIAATGVAQTVAGNGMAGYSGGGGPATSTGIDLPQSVFVDSSRNIFFPTIGVVSSIPCGGCPASSQILEVVAATGLIQTVAGNGGFGYGGDGGPAINAELEARNVFVDSAGNIFIADSGNHRIREVAVTTGIIQTVAGNGSGSYSGDGGLATSAELNNPTDVFVDNAGNIFIADSGNNRIREVTAATGIIQTVAGNGSGGYSGDGGLATSAELNDPADVFVDSAGNIFIADSGNNRIREMVAATGIIQTVVGTGVYGYSGDGGPAAAAELAAPSGLAGNSGNLLIADSGSQRIRSVSGLITTIFASSLSPQSLGFGNQLVGTSSNTMSATLTNTGSAALTISSIVVAGPDSGDFSQTNTCGASITPSSNCQVNVTFKPAAAGMRTASLTVTDNVTGSPQSVALTGTGIASAVTLSATSLTFSGQLISTTSGAQPVTVTNSGTAPLIISSIAISGTNSGEFAETNTCPASSSSLAAGANCTISVTFTPATTSNRSAAITIADNAGGTQSVSLTGVGTDFSLAAAAGANCTSGGNCSTSATISAGQTSTYNLQVSQLSGFNGTVALTCNGAPGSSTCSVSPASVPPGGSTSYAFTVTVGNTSNVLVVPWPEFPLIPMPPALRIALLLLLELLLILWWGEVSSRNRTWRTVLQALAVLLVVVMMSSGCAGGGGTVGNTQPPTDATLTITGASGTVKHQLSLSLTVNH